VYIFIGKYTPFPRGRGKTIVKCTLGKKYEEAEEKKVTNKEKGSKGKKGKMEGKFKVKG
jgi:hypothetical protein